MYELNGKLKYFFLLIFELGGPSVAGGPTPACLMRAYNSDAGFWRKDRL
jgi:hypothetical protein